MGPQGLLEAAGPVVGLEELARRELHGRVAADDEDVEARRLRVEEVDDDVRVGVELEGRRRAEGYLVDDEVGRDVALEAEVVGPLGLAVGARELVEEEAVLAPVGHGRREVAVVVGLDRRLRALLVDDDDAHGLARERAVAGPVGLLVRAAAVPGAPGSRRVREVVADDARDADGGLVDDLDDVLPGSGAG